MIENPLHKAQVSILRSLRYAKTKRFSDLMKPTGYTSDTFKFHLRKLVDLGYVAKSSDGSYFLTATGKEYAINVDEVRRVPKRQPKVSVFITAVRKRSSGETEYLLFKRARNPFMGFWTGITDTVYFSESFEDRAATRLLKQTELHAEFSVQSFWRIRDYESEGRHILEDKLFVVMLASDLSGEPTNIYPGGEHAWLTMDEFLAQEKYFTSTIDILRNLSEGKPFISQDLYHLPEDY